MTTTTDNPIANAVEPRRADAVQRAVNAARQELEANGMDLTIVNTGRKFLHAVAIDRGVQMVSIPVDERRRMRPLAYKSQPYPVRRAARRFLEAGKTLGITKSARTVLNAVREQIKEAA